MRSPSQHSFARVPSVDIPRSSFKRNMTYKTTFNAGYLIPFYLDEILPGDTFNFKMSSFARILSPLKYPIMDNLYMDFQFFFVPIRLVYDDYEKFFGSSKGQSGNWEYDDSHLLPTITFAGGVSSMDIGDYFGLPVGVSGLKVNALPFRCYNKIINDWYLPSVYEMTGPTIKTDSTDDLEADYYLQKRIKRPDYITTALISPQRGPGASISLNGDVPVVGDGYSLGLIYSGSDNAVQFGLATAYNTQGALDALKNASNVAVGTNYASGGTAIPADTAVGVSKDPAKSHIKALLSSATAVSINDLRQAFQLQRALERDMLGGVKYVEQLMSHFGVRSPDARLQRSEYLGGGSVPINIHTVANTAGASGGEKQASLAAFGVAGSNGIGWVKSFTEHGYVLGLVSVRADLTYQQGLPRLFDRRARFDFYYPVFSHLGEQTILNKEVYCQGPSVVDSDGKVIDEQPFGYQERFGEYRYGVSKITGLLRSGISGTLDAWHLSQYFTNLPTLNYEFLEEDVPMSRVKAVTGTQDFLFDALLSVNCVRPMPLFGVPGLVDHF